MSSHFLLLRSLAASAVGAVALFVASLAHADSISPTSFAASLGLGESVTITKTVIINRTIPTAPLVDIVFLFDTSISMTPDLAGAKQAAINILTSVGGVASVGTGTGYSSDPGSDGVVGGLTPFAAAGVANINAITLGLGGNGSVFPEEGFNATRDAAMNTAWRSGSTRFVIALGDATFLESDGATQANTIAALNDANATFFGVDFGDMTNTGLGGVSPAALGSIFDSTTAVNDIFQAIRSGLPPPFATYTNVTVDDLGAGLPEIDVTTVCTYADPGGSCVGANAVGSWDRSGDRYFEFAVTFTRTALGDKSFSTHALVDGAIVASESDRFTAGGTVPEPTSLMLVAAALLGLGASRRQA